MNTELISDLHNRNQSWIKHLEFCEDELKTFNNRLNEVVMVNNKIEVTSRIEQFQNQFIRQNEVIDILKHDIRQDEMRLVNNARVNNVATDHRRMEANQFLVDGMETFEKLYDELKNQFTRFLTETY